VEAELGVENLERLVAHETVIQNAVRSETASIENKAKNDGSTLGPRLLLTTIIDSVM